MFHVAQLWVTKYVLSIFQLLLLREAGAKLSPALILRVRWESPIHAQTPQGQAESNTVLWVTGGIWAACQGEPMNAARGGANRPHAWGRGPSLPTWDFQCAGPGLTALTILLSIALRSPLLLNPRATVFPIHPPFPPPPVCPTLLISPLKSVLFAKSRISYFKSRPLLLLLLFWEYNCHFEHAETVLLWIPKTLPCGSHNEKQFPLYCFSL